MNRVDGHGLVFCHVDLVQDAEAALLRRLGHRAPAQPHLAAGKGVCADEGAAVCVHVEGDIIAGPAKQPGQIIRQNVLARGLLAAQQDIFSLQKGGHGQI